MAVDLNTEVGHLRSQVQGLQTAVSQGANWERELKARSDGETPFRFCVSVVSRWILTWWFFRVVLADEIAWLRELLDAERGEHVTLRDAVRVICDELDVVRGEGTSSLTARVLGTYRRAHKIAVEALHTSVRRAFGVFGSHYSSINFAGMSEVRRWLLRGRAGRDQRVGAQSNRGLGASPGG